jgi:hypothetical protein
MIACFPLIYNNSYLLMAASMGKLLILLAVLVLSLSQQICLKQECA